MIINVARKDHFGERIAKTYEERWRHLFEPSVVEPAVAFIAALAGSGAALELGIGTGRLALPLSDRGVRVHGIDLSPAMIAELRTKPGAERIDVTVGDFATAKVDGTFRVAYLVRNTIMNLTTQDEQVACFQNVGAHLEAGGCFVMEVLVPGLRRLPPGEVFQAFDVTPDHIGVDEYIDIATQRLVSHHWWAGDGDIHATPFRYVWPSELDLMARLAGMSLRERWANWDRDHFSGDSPSHISVWQK
jgi:SAM-dependent methyltransferase